MEVKVVKPFCDKFNLTRCFQPGEVVDFEQSRAENIVGRGLGEFVKKAAKKEIEPTNEPAPVQESESVFEQETVDAGDETQEGKKGRKPRQKKAE